MRAHLELAPALRSSARPPKPVEGVGGSILWLLYVMNDNSTTTVILPAQSKAEWSERSLSAMPGEQKDLYFPRPDDRFRP